MNYALTIALLLAQFIIVVPKKPTPPVDPPPQGERATDITAAGCTRDQVNTALTSATDANADGFTVIQIPACADTGWSTGIDWTAPANTILRGAGSLTTQGGNNVTNIVDNYTANDPLIHITIPGTGVFRFSGLTIKGGAGGLKDWGFVRFDGAGTTNTLRVDHITIDARPQSTNVTKLMTFLDGIVGVLDSSVIHTEGNAAFYPYQAINNANLPWSAATNFGSNEYFFFEDNQYNGDVTTISSRFLDCFSASKVVIRFNTLKYSGGPEVHATGHAGDNRGCRSMETYNNRFSEAPGQSGSPSVNAYDIHDASSGTSLIWGNTADANAIKNFVIFNVTRKNNNTYNQSATPSGWGYCGTAFNGTGSNWDGNTDASTGYPCIDQPGRGIGDLLTGSFPSKVNNTTSTIAWPNQALEPIHVWNIVGTPVTTFYSDASNGRVVANRDYYGQASGVQTSATSPFNGTTGTGWGTLANRPTTCTTGVGYFATDQGTWNTSTTNVEGVQRNGEDGQLYRCTSTNTWTLYYTPYTYPHPLRTS